MWAFGITNGRSGAPLLYIKRSLVFTTIIFLKKTCSLRLGLQHLDAPDGGFK